MPDMAAPRLVALGGSAGMLPALEQFFRALPGDCGAAFIVLQHFSPERPSELDRLLANVSPMPVHKISDGQRPLANRIYILPKGGLLELRGGILHTLPLPEAGKRPRPIDHLFFSLARDQGAKAAGVVLSGTLDDGTRGVAALKEAGAVVLAQSPDTAQFGGMPQSALGTGLVDLTLDPGALARAACVWAREGRLPVNAAASLPDPVDDPEALAGILDLVHEHARRDLSGYKPATLRRRIERRMQLMHMRDMATYQTLLQSNSDELDRLAKDLLIGVTSFFRDPEAFAVLAEQVLPDLLASKAADAPIRAWLAGCSTGEEVYSLAILLFECYERAGLAPRLQIFATDIDDAALEVARAGHYPATALAHLAPERLRRFFVRAGNGYRIGKQVRESIVFAAHNLISDPPFSRIDLLVCRNLLIYLAPETQQRLIRLFRFALLKGGYLFLGSSETAGETRRKFEVVSKSWRIYRSLSVPRIRHPELPMISATGRRQLAVDHPQPQELGAQASKERIFRHLLEAHGPTLLLVNRNQEVLHIFGNTAPYMALPSGEPTRDLLSLIRPDLRIALRSALNRARRGGSKAVSMTRLSAAAAEPADGMAQNIRLSVQVLPEIDRRKLLLVSFELDAAPTTTLNFSRQGGDDWLLRQLEQELSATREDLQRNVDKMRIANEELKASNEEATAMNEELQSANEELESSKEELQSLNDELVTSNAALDGKVEELERTNTDLSNLLVSTETATLFLDRAFRIKRFTPACTRLMNLIAGDVGRPLNDIASRIDDKNLLADCRRVLAEETSITRETRDDDGHWYLRRVLPYRTMAGQVAGVVITFSEVTSLKQAQQDIAHKADELQRQNKLLQHAHVLARDLDDRITFWNRGAEILYGWSRQEAQGSLSHELLHTRFNEPLAEIKQQVLNRGVWDGELTHTTRDGHERVVASHWELYRDAQGKPTAIVEINNDITELKKYESKLLASRSDLDYLAHHDPLTHLPNRALFRDRLEHAMSQADVAGKRVGLLFLDLDRFKVINDSLGHEVGDRLLVAVANRLRGCLDRRHTLARTGGDEFAVLEEGLEDVTHASKTALDLIDTLRAAFQIDGHELYVGASVGISIYPDDTRDIGDLLKSADAAMYLAKERGRGNYQFATHELQQRANRYLSVETRLRKAIERGELRLHYQPQVNLADGRIVGAEALARWHNPELGRVPTDEFIHVAEDTGLIIPLGEWAILTACRQIRAWRDEGREVPRLAVNISATQFHAQRLVEIVAQSLEETGIDAGRLELELTERILLQDVDAMVRTMVELKRLGVHLSIDDFGTGYSSLTYLRRLPLDHLKVAREFIPMGAEDASNLSIARAIVTLARHLGLTCTVEGVETQAQLNQFKEMGCDQVQGFLISQALSGAEFARLLDAKTRYAL